MEQSPVKHHKLRHVLLVICAIMTALAIAFGIYVNVYYHAGDAAMSYIENSPDIPLKLTTGEAEVKEDENGYFFDGPGTDTAIIFYPGAKVQTESYAPILYLTAQCGYDCFLVDMPFRLAFFGINRAEEVMEHHPEYEHWYMAGHSLGGAMAGNFAADHPDQIDGVIFMAAYPTKSLEGSRVLSLYGSKDGVLNREHYADSLPLMPEDFTEVVIEGGNHAQFGDYGAQKGDGEASIGANDQWLRSVEAIVDFMRQSN